MSANVRKFSILGALLTVMSIVIASVNSFRKVASMDYIGTLRISSDYFFQLTCVLTYVPDYACIVSGTTDTSFGGHGTYDVSSTDNVSFDDYPSTSYGVNTTE